MGRLEVGFFLFLLLAIALKARGEMFTALVHMEGLVQLEEDLTNQLQQYVRRERARLDELEVLLSQSQSALRLPRDEHREHLYHPTNALALIKRYHSNWNDQVGDLVYQDNSHDLMSLLSLNKYRFPSKEDFKGAVIAIMRLQDTYLIGPSNLTAPSLGGVSAVNFTAKDCFDIGREAYTQEQWWFVKEWMLECLNKMYQTEQDSNLESVDLAEVYDHLSFAEYQLGDARSAMQHTKDLLQNVPDHERALSNMDFFQREMGESPEKYERFDVKRERNLLQETLNYEELCRQAPPIPRENYRKMVCFYFNHHRNPRLILKPIKVEVMNLKPRIWAFIDFLTEPEMTRLKEVAQPKLQRATARNWKTGQFEPADYRISKSGWLGVQDDDTGVVERINQRIEDTTGLTMTTAEEIQVGNYGIGGHYEPHFDFAREEEDAFSKFGHRNRISTVLMYMSNVTLGGATVFPVAGARIAPTNGMAVFWWNLKRSGDGDLLTQHAACPVLVGAKWVCNKWIHEAGQEFRRRCSLSKNK